MSADKALPRSLNANALLEIPKNGRNSPDVLEGFNSSGATEEFDSQPRLKGLSQLSIASPLPSSSSGDGDEYDKNTSLSRLFSDKRFMRPVTFIEGNVPITTENIKATSFIVKSERAGNDIVNNAPAGDNIIGNLTAIATVADRVFDVNYNANLFEACDALTAADVRNWMLTDERIRHLHLRTPTALYCMRASSFVDTKRDLLFPFGLFRPCYQNVRGKSWWPSLCVQSWPDAWQILAHGEPDDSKVTMSIVKKSAEVLKAIVTFNSADITDVTESAFRTSLGLGLPQIPHDRVKECSTDDADRNLVFQNSNETAIVIAQSVLACKLNHLRASIHAFSQAGQSDTRRFHDEHLSIMNFVNNVNHVSLRNEMAYMHICDLEAEQENAAAAAAAANEPERLRQMSPAFSAWSTHFQSIQKAFVNIVGDSAAIKEHLNSYFALLAFVICKPVPPKSIFDASTTLMTVSFDFWVNEAHIDIAGKLAFLGGDVKRNAQKDVFLFGLPSRDLGRDAVKDFQDLAVALLDLKKTKINFPILYPTSTGPASTTPMRRIRTYEHMGVLSIANVVANSTQNSGLQTLHMSSKRQTPDRLLLIRANPSHVVMDRLINPITLNSVVLPIIATDPIILKQSVMRRLFLNYTARPVKPPKRGLRDKNGPDDNEEPVNGDEEDENDEDFSQFNSRSNFVCILRARVPREFRATREVSANMHMQLWESYLKQTLDEDLASVDEKFLPTLSEALFRHINSQTVEELAPEKFVQYAIDVMKEVFKIKSDFATTRRKMENSRHNLIDVEVLRQTMIDELEAKSEEIGKRLWHTQMWFALWLSLGITEIVARSKGRSDMPLREKTKMQLIDAWRVLISWFVTYPLEIVGTDQCFYRGHVLEMPEQLSQRYAPYQRHRIEDIVAHYLSAITTHGKPAKPVQLLGTAVLPMHALKLAFMQKIPAHGRWNRRLHIIKLLCALHDMQTHSRLFSRASLPLGSSKELEDSEILANSIVGNMSKSQAFQDYLSFIIAELPDGTDERRVSQCTNWWKLFTRLPNYRATSFGYFENTINGDSVPAAAAAAAAVQQLGALEQEITDALKEDDKKLDDVHIPLLFRPISPNVGANCRATELLLSGAVRAIPVATLVDLNKMVNRISMQLREKDEFTDVITEMLIAAKITAAVEHCYCTKGSTIEILLNRGSWLGKQDADGNSVSEAVDALVHQLAMQFAIRMMVANQAKGGAAPTFVVLLCSDLALHFSNLATHIVPKLLGPVDDDEQAQIKTAFVKWTGIGAAHYDPQQPIAPQYQATKLFKPFQHDATAEQFVAVIYESASIVMNQLRLWTEQSTIPHATWTRLIEALTAAATAAAAANANAGVQEWDMEKQPTDGLEACVKEDRNCKSVANFSRQLATLAVSNVKNVRDVMRLCFDSSHVEMLKTNLYAPTLVLTGRNTNLQNAHLQFVAIACRNLLHLRKIGAGHASAAWMQQLRQSLVILTELAHVAWDLRAYGMLKTDQIASIYKMSETDLTLPSSMCAYWNNDCHIVELATKLFPQSEAKASDDDDDDEDEEDDDVDDYDDKKPPADEDENDDAFFTDHSRSFASGSYMFTALGNIMAIDSKFRPKTTGLKDVDKGASGDAVEDDDTNGYERPQELTYAPLTSDDPYAPVVTFINTLSPMRQFTVWFPGMDFPNWIQAVAGNQFASSKLWKRYLYGGPLGGKFLAKSTFAEEMKGIDALLGAQEKKFTEDAAPEGLQYIMIVKGNWAQTAREIYGRLLAANQKTQGKAIFIFIHQVSHERKTLWLPYVVRVPTPIGARLLPDVKQTIQIDWAVPVEGARDTHKALREKILQSNSALLHEIRKHAVAVYQINNPNAVVDFVETQFEMKSVTTSTTCQKAYQNGMKHAYNDPTFDITKTKWIARKSNLGVQVSFKAGSAAAAPKPAAAAAAAAGKPEPLKPRAPESIGAVKYDPWVSWIENSPIPKSPFIYYYEAPNVDIVRNARRKHLDLMWAGNTSCNLRGERGFNHRIIERATFSTSTGSETHQAC
jgi:hypothetical protein